MLLLSARCFCFQQDAFAFSKMLLLCLHFKRIYIRTPYRKVKGVGRERSEEMLEVEDNKTFERYMWWILHRHTPVMFVTYFNNAVVTIEYCSGCHTELYRDVRGIDLSLDKDKLP
jgi:hypothetical protein